MKKFIRQKLTEANEINNKINSHLIVSEIEKIIKLASKSILSGGKIIFCGNGGSASDSMHLVAELIGRFKKNRKPIPSVSLNSEISTITAIANDFGYNEIFDRQLESIGQQKDFLISISTSGKSKNIIKVLLRAKKMKIKSMLLTSESFKGNKKIANIIFKAPTSDVARAQEVHILIGHLLCEALENLTR